jgi:tRNA modification GTPase
MAMANVRLLLVLHILLAVTMLQTSRAFRIASSVSRRSLSSVRFEHACVPHFSRLFSSSSVDSYDEDTIFALSSGASSTATAVAVIRITGPQSHSILERLTPKKVPTRKAVVRNLNDPTDGSPLDQALVLKFDGPQSFTGEDVVEFHCHGSRAVVQGLLKVLGNYARIAERGEFTQRAFASGKLNLLEVEALADLLTADTQLQRQQALRQLDGKLSALYDSWRLALTKGLAHAEAVIDFGDDEHLGDDDYDDGLDYDGAQESVWGAVGEKMESLSSDMKRHLADDRRGELVREGVKVAIVGPPNAGKSSLFNILAQRDAAIVSPVEGTTRDVLELTLDLGGVRCTLSDTAGVREETEDLIEKEGIKRARNAAAQADVLVAMIDGSDSNNGIAALKDVVSDPEMLARLLLVVNKMDLIDDDTSVLNEENPLGAQHNGTYVLSCETNEGVDGFLGALTDRVVKRVSNPDPVEGEEESALITRARHRQHVMDAVEALDRFTILSTQGNMAVDMAAEELRLAVSELGRITGAVDVEEVLDVLFADFCIGK